MDHVGRHHARAMCSAFGIMLVEVFTGKRPTDPMLLGDLSIRQWVLQSFPPEIAHVVDDQLLQLQDAPSVACNIIFELGLICSSDSPDQRMSMRDVVVTLKKILKDYTKGASTLPGSSKFLTSGNHQECNIQLCVYFVFLH
jgi:hypothetical protein